MNSSIPEADTDAKIPTATAANTRDESVLSYAGIIRIFMQDYSISKSLPDLPFITTLVNLDRLESLCLILQDKMQLDHRYIEWLQELKTDSAALSDSKYIEACMDHRKIMYGLIEENLQLQRFIAHGILSQCGLKCEIVPSPFQDKFKTTTLQQNSESSSSSAESETDSSSSISTNVPELNENSS